LDERLNPGAKIRERHALLSVENFAAVAKQSFDRSLGEASLPLTLVEVQPLPVTPTPE
jgi:hypothetical protein